MNNTQARKREYQYGKWAESFCAFWLRLKGYQIVARNFKEPVGEIDIIARRRKTLVFIEVKKRCELSAEGLLYASQCERINQAASLFVAKRQKFANFAMRFDLVVIRPWKWPWHIKNAWQV